MDYTVHEILQARTLKWVDFLFSRGIFPTQGSNPGLPHCRQILYQLSHKGSPRILEWIGYPLSRVSSWPRNQTRVSCFAGRYFTNWAIKEVCRKEEVTLNYLLSSIPASTLPPWHPKTAHAPNHCSWISASHLTHSVRHQDLCTKPL